MTELKLNSISMIYDEGFRALNDVSIHVKSGEFATLLGPSGCGKTTLLRVIGGLLEPTEGAVEIGGIDVTWQPPEKRDTAMVFQSYALFPHMTVEENVAFGLAQSKVPKPERRERLDAALEAVSLENQRNKQPSQLSGGQQQRVALARALALQPGIILFDEPLSNLDARLREQLRDELRQLQVNNGFTAVYVTHDQAEALAMSDAVYVMDGGEVVQSGSPELLYRQPVNRFVADFLGEANIFSAEIIGRGDSATEIRTAFGDFSAASAIATEDDTTLCCWRPEHARLLSEDEPASANSFEAQILTRTFQGNVVDLVCEPVGQTKQRLRLQIGGAENVAANVGDMVRVSIAPELIVFLAGQ